MATRYGFGVVASTDLNLTISFEHPDEEGWIVARVLEVPGAMSQGRTREEPARMRSMPCARCSPPMRSLPTKRRRPTKSAYVS